MKIVEVYGVDIAVDPCGGFILSGFILGGFILGGFIPAGSVRAAARAVPGASAREYDRAAGMFAAAEDAEISKS